MKNLNTLKIVTAIALTLGFGSAQAATITALGNLMSASSAVGVSAVVTATCNSFTANGQFAFGNYTSGQQANVDSTTTVTANCTTGSAYTMFISAGSNYNQSTWTGLRNLAVAGTTNYLAYFVYVNNPGNALWGDGVNAPLGSGLAAVGNGANQTYTVAARIPGGQTAVVGNYTDNLVATLVY